VTLTHHQRISLAISALLCSALACRTATRMIIPDTPTPQPTSTATLTPTLTPTITPSLTMTATVMAEASCPAALDQIIEDSVATDHSAASNFDPDVTYLVYYNVINDELRRPLYFSVKKSLTTEQKDRAAHEAIWNYFARLIPEERRGFISGFSIFTDGPENYLAAVSQSDHSPRQWDLNVDIEDSGQKTSLTFTLIHEFGHLLTLASDQVDISQSVYDHPDDQDIYRKEVAACSQYFTSEGCSQPGSYINTFFDRFWTDLYAEWQTIDQETNEKKHDRLLEKFYKTYQDQFLTDYAPTSPSEDIAETFAFFILSPGPEDTSIANEKILFFYEYPELVELRNQILGSVCTEFQQ
jgi:hypothetical protein